MIDFIYDNHTRLILSDNLNNQLYNELKRFNASRVLLVFSRSVIEKITHIRNIENDLIEKGFIVRSISEVNPNPSFSIVTYGINVAKSFNADFILCIGGGSVIDAGKMISVGVNYNGDLIDFVGNKPIHSRICKLGVVTTISGSGSEVSAGAVITDDLTKTKLSFRDDKLRPLFAILVPDLTKSVPNYHVNCGIIDIFSHTLERFFTSDPNNVVTDYLTIGMLKAIVNLVKNRKEMSDSFFRSELMIASALSQSGVLALGRKADWASHFIAHEITSQVNLEHGATLAIIFPAWMKYVYKSNLERFKQYACDVFELDSEQSDIDSICVKGIECTIELFRSLDMPIRLSEVGLTINNVKQMAKNIMINSTSLGSFVELSIEDIENILIEAL